MAKKRDLQQAECVNRSIENVCFMLVKIGIGFFERLPDKIEVTNNRLGPSNVSSNRSKLIQEGRFKRTNTGAINIGDVERNVRCTGVETSG